MVLLFQEASTTFLWVWFEQWEWVAARGCGERGVVLLLFWDRTKDIVIPSGDEVRSEYRLWWTFMKWFGLEIRCC
ncbi:hypothetical protein V6N11_017661 [Hibiscus sabdariffa]|uniref:Uncharacterized protein n=1 Tax=Hibiscus sabdariffa TaxID=183260 RepID=A0ABR2TZ69_9ROSI